MLQLLLAIEKQRMIYVQVSNIPGTNTKTTSHLTYSLNHATDLAISENVIAQIKIFVRDAEIDFSQVK